VWVSLPGSPLLSLLHLLSLTGTLALAAPALTGASPGDALGAELGRTPQVVIEHQRAVAHLPLGERVAALSEPWLGAPYNVGPLGELEGVDPDPIIRYDTFDCLTFIEEAFALALAPDAVSAQQVRMGMRYHQGAPITYENRRHFMLAEWIPGVVEDGWFSDVTRRYDGAVRVEKDVTAATWAGWWGRSALPLDDERLPVGSQTFWYLPLDDALAQIDAIPPGTVVFFMRQPAAHIPIAITHVGVTVPGEVVTLRHASKLRDSLSDEPLAGYITHQRQYTKWPLTGVILLEGIDYGPRAPASDGARKP